jgi:hypothetical protein
MEKWLRSPDKDVAWVMQGNLTKARIAGLGQAWVAKWRAKAPKAAAEQMAAIAEAVPPITPAPSPKRAAPAKPRKTIANRARKR